MTLFTPLDIEKEPNDTRASQLYKMERELENQIKESMEESNALHEKLQADFVSARQDMERRSGERSLQAKRQQAKLKEAIVLKQKEKDGALQHAELLQQQLIIANDAVRLARNRIFELEAEAQSLRAQPPGVVKRADPDSVAETIRLRDRVALKEEETRRAQRAISEARQDVGKEVAINQGLQRYVDSTRHRLLALQGSLAEATEENAELRRELEAERIKMATTSRRLKDSEDRHEDTICDIRSSCARAQDQSNRLGQDYAVLSAKLRRLSKEHAARRLSQIIRHTQNRAVSRGLYNWMIFVVEVRHREKHVRHKRGYAEEIMAFEADLLSARRYLGDYRDQIDALRRSRDGVSEVVAKAVHRSGVAAIVEKRGDSLLKWCFWEWARLARSGNAATATRARRKEQESLLQNVKDQLSTAVARAEEAEKERDTFRECTDALREDNGRRQTEFEIMRTALNSTQSFISTLRSRCARGGAARLQSAMEKARLRLQAKFFGRWTKVYTESRSPPVESRHQSVGTNMASKADKGYLMSRNSSSSEDSLFHIPDPAEREQFTRMRLSIEPMHTDFSDVADNLQQHGDGLLGIIEVSNVHPMLSPASGTEFCDPTPRSVYEKLSCAPNEETVLLHSLEESRADRSLDYSPVARQHSETTRSTRAKLNVVGNENIASISSPTEKYTEIPGEDDPANDENPSRPALVPTLDAARIILALQTTIGEELYAVGERLMRCVEADHMEIHGKVYRPLPLTNAERAQFRACLEDTIRGPLGRTVLLYLETQESSRAVAIEKDRAMRTARRGGNDDNRGTRILTSSSAASACMDLDMDQDEISGLRTGPLSSPGQKTQAARVLRDRLMVLLDSLPEIWAGHRRPWQVIRTVNGPSVSRVKTTPTLRNRNLKSTERQRYTRPFSRSQGIASMRSCLDSGAGPRKFWETLRGPKFIDAIWDISPEELEDHLWELSNLVREQGRGQGLALRRGEHMRRVLDLRVYELLLLHVRTRLIWTGIEAAVLDEEPISTPGEGNQRRESNTSEVNAGLIGSISTSKPFLIDTKRENCP